MKIKLMKLRSGNIKEYKMSKQNRGESAKEIVNKEKDLVERDGKDIELNRELEREAEGANREYANVRRSEGGASEHHAVAKDKEPVRTGLVAMIEPCFDTMLICCLTGITIVITGAYQTGIGEGILITQKAFETVSSWFPILLTIAAPLFAFSSVISFVYCCEMGWLYLFGVKSVVIYRIAVVVVAFLSGLSKDIMAIANIGGALFSCLALINMTALILFSNQINNEVQCYLKRLRNNKIN